MEFNKNNKELNYKEKIINKTFKILGIYEDCEMENDLDNFYTYIDRLCLEYLGIYKNTKNDSFFSLYNILSGLHEDKKINHKKVKSVVFHCINVIKSVGV